MSEIEYLSPLELQHALALTDLSDPSAGPHALQQLIAAGTRALEQAWGCPVVVERRDPIVAIADNYDRLHYPEGGAARDARYTRYVRPGQVLRTQTSAMIPPLLRRLAEPPPPPRDVLLVCPGLVYRRDSIDRLHTGEPHQIDLWRIARDRALAQPDLHEMIALVLEAMLPGRPLRLTAAEHPYTQHGLQIDVYAAGAWVEVGECGLALPALLAENGHADATGLALGLGLDRVLMLRKGFDDIRLLRAIDPRVAEQMQDLSAYRPVSAMPAVARDLSLVVADQSDVEQLGDAVRTALGADAGVVETISLLAETPYASLPEPAIRRLGIGPGQKNVLLRVVLRALDRSLTHPECNQLRDRIYAALHRGQVWHWAAR